MEPILLPLSAYKNPSFRTSHSFHFLDFCLQFSTLYDTTYLEEDTCSIDNMSLTTLRPEFSPLPSNLLSKTQRRSFTPTNLISPHPSIHSPIPKSQKRPPPRLILRPDSQASSLSAGQKRERRFGNVRSKEIPLSVPNQMGGYGSIGQLRMITKDVKKDTVKRGQKKVIADNELHNMRYKVCRKPFSNPRGLNVLIMMDIDVFIPVSGFCEV